MNLFQGTELVLGVTGSIAAYKAAALASRLYQLGAQVQVAMTRAATEFVSPLTFASLTHRQVVLDVLALGADAEIEHVALARRARLVIVAPATANTLARIAHGFADDALAAIVLDTKAPILVAPAMETGMWESAATRANVEILQARGITFVEPEEGHLASGASGKGRMAEPEQIIAAARLILARGGRLAGKRVVVTAGGTREAIDPVRVISNSSSGRMGYALAEEALARGADVTLISSAQDLPPPYGARLEPVVSTQDLDEAVLQTVRGADALVMAAAPADFRPVVAAEQKIKKEDASELTLELVRNPDILGKVAEMRRAQPQDAPRVVVGFAAETNDLLANARAKLERKQLDLIVANPVPQTFGSDRVKAILLSKGGNAQDLAPMAKEELAGIIWDEVERLLEESFQ